MSIISNYNKLMVLQKSYLKDTLLTSVVPGPARSGSGFFWHGSGLARAHTARNGPARDRAARIWPGPFRAGLSSGLGLMARAGSGQKARIIF